MAAYDIVIRNGQVADGTGKKLFAADVALKGDRIASIEAPGSLKGLQLVVSDIAAAHAELVARGVAVSEIQHFEDGVAMPGPGGAYNSFIFFSDPDGNSWAVQEVPARA